MECVLTNAFMFDAGGFSMRVSTQMNAVRVIQSSHEVGQLNAHSTPWETRIASLGNASAIQRGIQAAMRAPEIRAHRLEELRAQIEAGTYEINSMALARKMLNAPTTEH